MSNVKTVRVELGVRGYDILIGEGLLARTAELIAPLMRPGRSRVFVVADENVAQIHGRALAGALENAGLNGHLIAVPQGEESKTFAYLATVLDELIELGAERDDLILAFGGFRLIMHWDGATLTIVLRYRRERARLILWYERASIPATGIRLRRFRDGGSGRVGDRPDRVCCRLGPLTSSNPEGKRHG